MNSNKLYSPLRYPGGKACLTPFIAMVMKANELENGHYFEPFAGGAAVALELLFDGHVQHIHINDADYAIYAFWKAIVHHTHEFLDMLDRTPITMDEWFYQRSILNGETESNLVEKGFATLFLNRTNRSGILKAGVVGGKHQSGKYKLDARFKKEIISSRIKAIARRSDDITIYGQDALTLLGRCHEFLPLTSLIYLDPPYYIKGKILYRNFYNHDDHIALSSKIQEESFKFPWMVSYDNAKEIIDMYRDSRSVSYELKYTAQKRYVGNEVAFFSHGMVIPNA